MKKAIVLLWLFLSWVPLSAQTATSPQMEGMKKLDFLAGEWKGEGWISFGPGKPHTFTQTETIKAKLGGMLLVVEGLGKSNEAGKQGTIVHNAFAVVSYDDAAKQIRWHAYTADGRYVDTDLKPIQERVLQWSIISPGRTIRFTMNLSEKDQWLETGEFSQDGKSWMKFLEMKLQRAR